MNGIDLRALQYDGPELHLELKAANNFFSGTMDFYCYPEDLAVFGQELIKFPKSPDHVVQLKFGDETGGWAYYVLLRAYVHDSVGHSSLKVCLDNFASAPYGVKTEFDIACEPASLNRLGDMLVSWASSCAGSLQWRANA